MNNPTLEKLNRDTFAAETMQSVDGKPWDVFLTDILAAEFQLRRSKAEAKTESSADLMAAIRKAERHPVEVKTWDCETLGVVTCAVILKGADGKDHRYQNVKVFERRKDGKKDPHGDWQCVYWQVTEAPMQVEEQA